MAEVFLARDRGIRGFEKLVVVKRILEQRRDDAQAVRMFLDEARLMAALDHPNIVHVHEVGRARGGYFFVMEYVRGADVRTIQRASARTAVRVPLPLALGLVAEAAAGLHHAHEKRGPDGAPLAIVHRDVSPSNILVSFGGAVKVADFGIAKWAKQESETRTGGLKGKLTYMSPEQCRGEPLDRRSDVFSLGVVLYELCTGTRLYQGPGDFDILNQIVTQDAPPPSLRWPDCPSALERVILRALARVRDQRYGTARELAAALQATADEAGLRLSPEGRAEAMEALFGPPATNDALAPGPAEHEAELEARGADARGTSGTRPEGGGGGSGTPGLTSVTLLMTPRKGRSGGSSGPRRTRAARAVVGAGAIGGAALVAILLGLDAKPQEARRSPHSQQVPAAFPQDTLPQPASASPVPGTSAPPAPEVPPAPPPPVRPPGARHLPTGQPASASRRGQVPGRQVPGAGAGARAGARPGARHLPTGHLPTGGHLPTAGHLPTQVPGTSPRGSSPPPPALRDVPAVATPVGSDAAKPPGPATSRPPPTKPTVWDPDSVFLP